MPYPQAGDPAFAALLERLRFGELTHEDVYLLNSRDINSESVHLPADFATTPPEQCATAFVANSTRELYNAAVTVNAAESGATVFRLKSHCKVMSLTPPDEHLNEYYRLPESLSEFRPLSADLYVGMCICITNNLSTALDVANGTLATIASFQFPEGTTYTTETTRLAGRRTVVTVPSAMPEYIVVNLAGRDADAEHPHPVFDGLRANQFPLVLPQLTSTKLTLANRGTKTIRTNAYAAVGASAMTGERAALCTVPNTACPLLRAVSATRRSLVLQSAQAAGTHITLPDHWIIPQDDSRPFVRCPHKTADIGRPLSKWKTTGYDNPSVSLETAVNPSC